MNVLDLFSGIGGFSLGLERAGMRTVAFCEIEPYCRAVLRKHWPDVPIYEDVRTLTADRLRADGIIVDVICGGFPCQDISFAGNGAGIDGARSGLWWEYHRIIGEVRPRWIIIENVSALRSRGLDRVLGSLAEIGYDAEWHCIPAAAVGAPHRRDRVWCVAYPQHPNADDARSYREAEHEYGAPKPTDQQVGFTRSMGKVLAGAHAAPLYGQTVERREPNRDHAGAGEVADAHKPRLALGKSIRRDDGTQQPAIVGSDWWRVEPDVGRVAHGVPRRVDRLKSLGNAVVPQIPEIIGRAIIEAEGLSA